MNSKLVIKFLLAMTLGAALGERVYLDHEKWQRLGREAYLAHQAHQFDQHSASAAGLIIFCAILALGLSSLYEAIAFAILKIVTHIVPEKPAGPAVSS